MDVKIFLLLIFLSSVAFGQNKQLLYNFESLPQNLMTNPGAETSFDMHAGLPFFSQISVSAGSTGITMYDLFKVDDGSINDRIRESLSDLSNKDFFSVHQQMELIFLGWRDQRKRYFSAGIYQELDAFLYFPKDLAILAYEGNKAHMNKSFKFSDAAFTAEVVNVFHFGFTNYYSEDLNYGVRGKLYSGIFNAQSINNRGVFRTVPTPEDNNVYRHFVNGLDANIYTSGWASLNDEDMTAMQTMNSLGKKAFLGGNLGLGVDLGFSYYLNDKTKITGSILDLGFINQKKDIENYRYYGNYYTDGIEIVFPGPGEERPSYWDDWEDHLDENLQDETYYDSYLTWRPVKLNASVDFGFDEDAEPCNCRKPTGRRRYLQHLGFQWFAIRRPKGFIHALTVAYDKKINNNFSGKVSYTVDSFSYSNVGLMVSTRFNKFNFYLAADNLLSYPNLANANNVSLQLGFQLIFNRE
jgi:hypothetical protein